MRLVLQWVRDFRSHDSFKSQQELHAYIRTAMITAASTLVHIRAHCDRLLETWSCIKGNTITEPAGFWHTLIHSLPADRPTSCPGQIARAFLTTRMSDRSTLLRYPASLLSRMYEHCENMHSVASAPSTRLAVDTALAIDAALATKRKAPGGGNVASSNDCEFCQSWACVAKADRKHCLVLSNTDISQMPLSVRKRDFILMRAYARHFKRQSVKNIVPSTARQSLQDAAVTWPSCASTRAPGTTGVTDALTQQSAAVVASLATMQHADISDPQALSDWLNSCGINRSDDAVGCPASFTPAMRHASRGIQHRGARRARKP